MATEDIDYYGLLELPQTATLQEIKTAYRKKSLKVHPDRNPDNPEAARLFHELRLAADLLSDPTQRASFDSLLNARNARKLRFSALDNKRKSMAEDLERRENEFKRRKEGEDLEGRKRGSELERLKEEGRRMREVKEKQIQSEEAEGVRQKKDEEKKKKEMDKRRRDHKDGIVELGPLDKTLKIKWLRSLHPALVTSESITEYLAHLLKPNKLELESIVISAKTTSGKGKYGSGVVSFKSLTGAVRVVKGKRKEGEGGDWKGFEVDWASGSPPDCLKDEEGIESSSAKPPPPPPPPSTTQARTNESLLSASMMDSSEDRILEQLRQREREKLIEEMKRQDEEDEAAR